MLCGMSSVQAGKSITNTRLNQNPHQGKACITCHASDRHKMPTDTKGLGDLNIDDPFGNDNWPPIIGGFGEEYKIKCHLIYDESLFYASAINYIGGNGLFKANSHPLEPGTKDTEIKLSEGTYDFMVTFISYDTSGNFPPQSMLDGFAPEHHIMIENITLDDNIELTFDISDATNYIEFSPVNHNGEEFRVGVVRIIEEDPGYIWDNSDANTWDVQFYKSFYNTAENDFIYGLRSNYGHRTEDGRCGSETGNFFINNVSDKYVFYHNVVAYEGDNNYMWSINLATHADGSKIVTNTADEFKQFTQTIGKTNAFGKYQYESYYGAEAEVSVGGHPLVSYCFYYDGEEAPTCFMAQHNQVADDFNTHTLAYPRTNELAVYNESYGEWMKAGIKSCAIALDNGTLRYENPFTPYFNTLVSNENIMGTTTPVLYCPVQPLDYEMKRPIMSFNPQFIGQYGEERDIDLLESGFEATHNGNIVCNSIEDFYRWMHDFADDEHQNGTVTLKFVNNNIRIDDIIATNITEISYREGSEDICPPVLQFVRFKQAFPEKYGPRLSNQFGKIEFLAGDMNSDGYETEYSAADVSVEYAPHGTDDFTLLESTHTVEADSENGLPVYITLLTDMKRKSADGWFDFRFTITDASGNTTVETLKPAVYIQSLHDESDMHVISSDDDTEPEYYNMAGLRVITPEPGQILIEKRGDNTRRIITR